MTKKQRKKLKAKQVKAFIDLGSPEEMGISEKKFKKLVPIPKNKKGALLIVSPQKISVFDQLNLVGIKNYLNLAKLKDAVEISDQMVYWIYDVEDGTKMLGKSPENCQRIFKEQHRRGLTVAEAIALYIQSPEILKNHYIDISGSSFDSACVLDLRFSVDGPWLGYGCAGSARSYYGSPSCGI